MQAACDTATFAYAHERGAVWTEDQHLQVSLEKGKEEETFSCFRARWPYVHDVELEPPTSTPLPAASAHWPK